jgi:DNA-binding transcriptional LysR family regulator
MEIRNLKTFLRVTELLNFSQTAGELGYSQSAVTVQIKQLEEELGIQLFERIGKRVILTEHGKRLIPYAADVLQTIQAAKIDVSGSIEPAGTLRVGVIESLSTSILPAILIEYQKRCPLVQTSIVTGLNTDMFEMVQKNEIDIAYFLDEKTYRSEWIKVIERPEPIVFVAASGHPLTGRKNVKLETIMSEPLVLTEKGFCYRYALDQLVAEHRYELHPVLEMGNTDVIAKMLINHVGVSFLPLFVAQEYIDAGQLSIIPINGVKIQMWSQLAYHKDKWLTPQMKLFIDTMKQFAST